MIVGSGIDIVRTDRMDRLLKRFGRRFAERILSPVELREWECSGQGAELLAKRFAVKEAAAKALRTGFREGIRYRDISLAHDERGAPLLHFSGEAERQARARTVHRRHVSVSDERGLAIAQVLLEGDDRGS